MHGAPYNSLRRCSGGRLERPRSSSARRATGRGPCVRAQTGDAGQANEPRGMGACPPRLQRCGPRSFPLGPAALWPPAPLGVTCRSLAPRVAHTHGQDVTQPTATPDLKKEPMTAAGADRKPALIVPTATLPEATASIFSRVPPFRPREVADGAKILREDRGLPHLFHATCTPSTWSSAATAAVSTTNVLAWC